MTCKLTPIMPAHFMKMDSIFYNGVQYVAHPEKGFCTVERDAVTGAVSFVPVKPCDGPFTKLEVSAYEV